MRTCQRDRKERGSRYRPSAQLSRDTESGRLSLNAPLSISVGDVSDALLRPSFLSSDIDRDRKERGRWRRAWFEGNGDGDIEILDGERGKGGGGEA